MRKKERIENILRLLDEIYGKEVQKYLFYNTPWELLIAVMLSAQCTDARVNMVTPDLFKRYPEAKDMAVAKIRDVEKLIHSTGFYHAKARNIIATSKIIHENYNDRVPSSVEELTQLPGVGRKTANVIRGNIFSEPSIVVDTHVKRLSKRLGFTKETDPEKVEYDLMKVLPKEHWIRCNTQLIAHGRSICSARAPKCLECPLSGYCPTSPGGR